MKSSRRAVMFAIFVLSLLNLPTDSLAVTYNSEWDASSGLPPDQACPAWSNFGAASPPISGGEMTLSTSSCLENKYYQQTAGDIFFPNPLIVEFRVRFVSGGTCGGCAPFRRTIAVTVTTAPNLGILFFIGQDEIILANGCSSTTSASVDTDGALHTYRIEITNTGTVNIFQDDTLVLQGATYSSPDHGPTPQITWGEGSGAAFGTAEWAFFRHNAHVSGCTGAPRYNSTWNAASGQLPEAACTPWTLVAGSPTLAGGVLTFATSSCSENQYYHQTGAQLALPATLVVEARGRFRSGNWPSSCDPCSAHRRSMIIFVATAPSTAILLNVGKDEVFLTTGNCDGHTTAVVDTDDLFHTYRLEITAAGAAKLFYDGTLILTGHTHFENTGAIPEIAWGEGSSAAYGTSDWEYVRHNAHAGDCDQDGDGERLEVDCDDMDSCSHLGAPELCDNKDNNCDGSTDEGSLFPPGVTSGLRVATDGLSNSLSWNKCGGSGNRYDVIKGDLAVLQLDAGDFSSSVLTCLENDSVDTTSIDLNPSSANAIFYLVRTASVCGVGTYDSGAVSQVGSRDSEVAASGLSCP